MHNPLLPQWSGPFGGVPPFDQVKVGHFPTALEAANTVDPAEGYRAFRGRDAKIDALMRRRGFDSRVPQ